MFVLSRSMPTTEDVVAVWSKSSTTGSTMDALDILTLFVSREQGRQAVHSDPVPQPQFSIQLTRKGEREPEGQEPEDAHIPGQEVGAQDVYRCVGSRALWAGGIDEGCENREPANEV